MLGNAQLISSILNVSLLYLQATKEHSHEHPESSVQNSKPTVEQQISVPQDPEMDFDEWMSYIDDNAHHFTTYVLEFLFAV